MPAFAGGGIDGGQAFGTFRAVIGQQANDQPADRAEQKPQCKPEAESASRFADERADASKGGNDEDPQVIAGPFGGAIAPSDFHPVVVHGWSFL